MNSLSGLVRLLVAAGALAAMTAQPALAAEPCPGKPIRIVAGNTPQQFDAFIKAEIAKWAKVIKDAKVELQ